MTTRLRRAHHARRRDDGVAMVEFAFVGVLLILLLVGIVQFGFLLSFKQDVTRSAAEGARVGAVAQPNASVPASPTDDLRHEAAINGTADAVDSFGQECGVDGMVCEVTIHDCDAPTIVPPPAVADYWDDGEDDCVTVSVIYDNDSQPLLPEPPILSGLLPDTIEATSVARLNQ